MLLLYSEQRNKDRLDKANDTAQIKVSNSVNAPTDTLPTLPLTHTVTRA